MKTKPYMEVKELLGSSISAFEKLAGHIRFYYEMDEIWWAGNPNHKHHSNLTFKRGGKSLTTFSLREDYFIVCVVFGKIERELFEQRKDEFGEIVRNVYYDAETLHDGKWLGFEVRDESLVDDIIKLLEVKRKPNRKVLPSDMAKCGKIDIGYTHAEVTQLIMG